MIWKSKQDTFNCTQIYSHSFMPISWSICSSLGLDYSPISDFSVAVDYVNYKQVNLSESIFWLMVPKG